MSTIPPLFMHCFFLILFLLLLTGCDNGSFEKDKRQIRAKDEIRNLLPPGAKNFDVEAFREDTLTSWKDMLKRPIRYRIDFVYKNATGVLFQKTGEVVFTPDGRSVLETTITSDHF